MSNNYICKECGMAVLIMADGEQIRPCGHKGAIILSMEVVCNGIGCAKQGK